MTTLVTPMPGRRRSVIVLFLKTGSRFESPEDNGLSHFVEHMLFRGTEAHPTAHRLATAFEELGGTLDATTAADHGTLGISVPSENLEAVIPLLAETYSAPLFVDLELERGIIREEVLEDLSEDGELIDPAGLARELAFGDNGLGQSITGSLHNVETFSEERLRQHHARTYIANDLVISIAGPVDPASITRKVDEAFSRVPRGSALTCTAPAIQRSAQLHFTHHPGSSQTALSLAYRCPSHTSPLEPAVDLLLRVIDDGMATRLYHRLCDSRGLCYSVSGSYEAYEDAGLVELEADSTHERSHLVLAQMLELTQELCESKVSEAEFARTQKRARWQHQALVDEAYESAEFMALAEMTKTARNPQTRLDELQAVTRDDIREAAGQIFAPAGRNVIAVGSKKKCDLDELERLALA